MNSRTGGERMKCQPRAAKSTMTESRQQCCCSSSSVLVSILVKLFRFRIIRVVTIQVVSNQITAILVSQYDLGQMFRCGELCEERRRRSRNIFAPSGSCRLLSQDCQTCDHSVLVPPPREISLGFFLCYNTRDQFDQTTPKPAYGRQGLDWIVGPGYSFVVF